MRPLIWVLLAALGLVELIGALTKYPTISETINRALTKKGIWVRLLCMAAWVALGIHLLFGWLQ